MHLARTPNLLADGTMVVGETHSALGEEAFMTWYDGYGMDECIFAQGTSNRWTPIQSRQ